MPNLGSLSPVSPTSCSAKRCPDSGWLSVRLPELLIDVTYSVESADPPKFTELGRGIGIFSLTFSLPSGSIDAISPVPISAVQRLPTHLLCRAPGANFIGIEEDTLVGQWSIGIVIIGKDSLTIREIEGIATR